MYNDMTHYEFQYKLGLNVDPVEFSPKYQCSKGGLYFCEESKRHLFWDVYGQVLAIIEIPSDARVYIEKDKFKADKLIIKEIIAFEDLSDDFWISMLHVNGMMIQKIKNQTEYVCRLAVKQDGFALRFVRNQTEDICRLAVQQDGLALQFVKNQTEEICRLAVQEYSIALQYVKDQTEDICRLAVQKNGMALKFVKNQTLNLCMMATWQDIGALMYVNNFKEIVVVFVLLMSCIYYAMMLSGGR